MTTKQVVWKIDVSAGTAEAAALEALRIMRIPGSTATVFDVTGSDGKAETVDLLWEIPVRCPCCGSERVAQADVVNGSAMIQAVRMDGTIIWAGEINMDWDSERPATRVPQHMCLACHSQVDLKEYIRKAMIERKGTRKNHGKRR